MKMCLSCRVEMDETCFAVASSKKGTRRTRCKSCVAEQEGRRPSIIIENQCLAHKGQRRCTSCFVVKDFSQYNRIKSSSDELKTICKDCVRSIKGIKGERRHYPTSERNKLLIPQRIKICLICDETKPYEQFHNYKHGVGGVHPWCKTCFGRKDRMRKYGLTMEQVIMAEAEETCWVCEIKFDSGPGTELHFDHCHETGTFRGVLCERCNVALGMLQNNGEIIKRLAQYIAIGIEFEPSRKQPVSTQRALFAAADLQRSAVTRRKAKASANSGHDLFTVTHDLPMRRLDNTIA